jgi:hypothetical protein
VVKGADSECRKFDHLDEALMSHVHSEAPATPPSPHAVSAVTPSSPRRRHTRLRNQIAAVGCPLGVAVSRYCAQIDTLGARRWSASEQRDGTIRTCQLPRRSPSGAAARLRLGLRTLSSSLPCSTGRFSGRGRKFLRRRPLIFFLLYWLLFVLSRTRMLCKARPRLERHVWILLSHARRGRFASWSVFQTKCLQLASGFCGHGPSLLAQLQNCRPWLGPALRTVWSRHRSRCLQSGTCSSARCQRPLHAAAHFRSTWMKKCPPS